MTDFFRPIEANAAFTPQKVAIRFEGRSWTYAALAARNRAVAEQLARDGVGPCDRVALLGHNHPDTLATLYACARLGAMMCPLNWRLADDELAFMIDHCGPKVLVYGHGFEERAATFKGPLRRALGDGGDLAAAADGEPPAGGGPGAPILLVYTSGTTGRPKAALIRQGPLGGNVVQGIHMHQMSADDHVLTVLPLFHVGALNIQTTPALMIGATVTIHARFHPRDTLAAIEADRPTLTVLVPATLNALMAEPGFAAADLSALRAIATGSTIVPEALIEAVEARGVPVLCIYGATETLPIAAYDRVGTPRVKGATGRAGVLSRIVIVDGAGQPVPTGTHGEIGVAGPVFSGYFRDDAATAAAHYGDVVRTGDIGSLAADGSLTVHDRLKNVIISGGENIYPAEVERVLRSHPAVTDCAVVGIPDPRWQEVPAAYVELATPVAPDVLVAHCAELLARYKVPRTVRVVDALPRTSLGKVALEALRAKVREDFSSAYEPAETG